MSTHNQPHVPLHEDLRGRPILPDEAVFANAIDFIRGEVIFAAPPAAGGSAPAPLF